MIRHYVTIDPSMTGEFVVKCSCSGLSKKYSVRNKAFAIAHLHIAGIDIDLIELALAGKEAHA